MHHSYKLGDTYKVGKQRKNPTEIVKKQFCADSGNSGPVPQELNLRESHRELLSMFLVLFCLVGWLVGFLFGLFF